MSKNNQGNASKGNCSVGLHDGPTFSAQGSRQISGSTNIGGNAYMGRGIYGGGVDISKRIVSHTFTVGGSANSKGGYESHVGYQKTF